MTQKRQPQISQEEKEKTPPNLDETAFREEGQRSRESVEPILNVLPRRLMSIRITPIHKLKSCELLFVGKVGRTHRIP